MDGEKQNYKELNKSVIGSNAFIMVNKKLMAIFGIKATIYLSTLIFKEDFFKERLDKDGYFWNTQEDIEESCLLSPNEQSESLKILKANDIVDFKKTGLPARNHFKINHKKIFEVLSSNSLVIRHILTGNKIVIDLLQNSNSYNNIEDNNIEGNNKEKFSSKEENSGFDKSKPPITIFVKKLNRRIIIASQFTNNNTASITKQPFKIDRSKMKKALQELNPPKEVKSIKTTPEIEEVLEHWIGLGLYVSKESTKTYREGIEKLKNLLDGILFNQKYSVEEIKSSISRFYTAAFDKDYKPMDKKSLKSINMSGFIYNKFTNGDAQSYFKKYLNENQPESVIPKLENKYPEQVNLLMRRFNSEIRGGISGGEKDGRLFIKASYRLKEFFDKNKHRIRGSFSLSEMADVLFDAVKKSYNGNMVNFYPGCLCSDATFNTRLPAHMTQQGIIDDNTSGGSKFNIYQDSKKRQYSDWDDIVA